jgi:hypothetical protein
MKNTNNSKIILVALAVVLAFGVIAIMPESANASYGYSGGGYSGGYYDGGGYNFYGSYSNSVYVQSLAGQESPWYPSIVVPIESQMFFMEQTWRRYGLDSSEFNSNSGYYNSGFNYNSHYSSSNFGNTRGGYVY